VQFDIDRSLEILGRTPSVMDVMLRGLSDEWVRTNEGGESWSAYDVVGHLIHGELADWIPRALIILDRGESRPFDPFDRFAQFEASNGKTLDELLDAFATLRATNVKGLRDLRLEPGDLARRGQHPEFGTVTLGQLLATWVVHDLGHVAQVARTMAKQYGSAVGPWQVYLPVLHR
jgi:uncharacterized damage-inducible protein DinB